MSPSGNYSILTSIENPMVIIHLLNKEGKEISAIDTRSSDVMKWSLDTLKKNEGTLKQLGLIPRLPISATDVFNFKDEHINNRNLIVWNFYNPIKPSEQVDIITHDLSKMKSIKVKYLDTTITVIAKGDLIKMKQKSGRQQDLLDIEALKKI